MKYDRLEHAIELLGEAQRNLERSDPPKGGYTSDLIKRIKRFVKQSQRTACPQSKAGPTQSGENQKPL